MVQIDDPPTMNVLGLFLAGALRRNLIERERACSLRGALTVAAEGMRATIRFEEDGVMVTRKPVEGGVVVSGALPVLVRAITRPGLSALLKVKVRGGRLFALRAMRYLAP